MAAVLTTGALYALVDASDEWHQAVVEALDASGAPLVAIAPVLTEAMRLVERILGRDVSLRLMDAALEGEVLWQPLDRRDLDLARQLLPMEAGLAPSAALAIAAAQRLGVETVLCVDPVTARVVARRGLRPLPLSGKEGR